MRGSGKSPLAWVRYRLKDRPDTEHEQALVRLVVGVVVCVYSLIPNAIRQSGGEALEQLVVFGVWALMSIGVFLAILFYPGVSPVRRVIGAIGDTVVISYFMVQTGVEGLLLYVVYLWIIFGNGVRYGRFYLVNTLILSVIGFSLVIVFSDFWRAHVGTGISLIFGMIGISLYLLTLVKRLSDVIERQEAVIITLRGRLQRKTDRAPPGASGSV